MRDARNIEHDLEKGTSADPLKCVWMLAGVVDYKLCDRQYECEDCAFDKALRERSPSQMDIVSATHEGPLLARWPIVTVRDQAMEMIEIRGYELAGALFYHPRHVWARVEEGGRMRMGLDDFGQKLVSRIYSVTLPEPGTRVSVGSACWRIAHRAGETMLVAPVAGVVEQVNKKLAQYPSLINHDPCGQGWALVIEPERLVGSLKHLYYGQQAEGWYQQEIDRLYRELRILVEDARPHVGVTLQDGGTPVQALTRAISASQLRQIIDTFLSATIGHEPGSTEGRAMTEGGQRR